MSRRSFLSFSAKAAAAALLAPGALLETGSKTAHAAASALPTNVVRDDTTEVVFFPEVRQNEGAFLAVTDYSTNVMGEPYKYLVKYNQLTQQATIETVAFVQNYPYSTRFTFDLKSGRLERTEFGSDAPREITRSINFNGNSAETKDAFRRALKAARMGDSLLGADGKLENQMGYWEPYSTQKGEYYYGVTAPGVMTWMQGDPKGISILSSFQDPHSKYGRFNMKYTIKNGEYYSEDLLLGYFDQWTKQAGIGHLSADARMNALRPVFLYSLYLAAESAYGHAAERATQEGFLYLPYGRIHVPEVMGMAPNQFVSFMESGVQKLFGTPTVKIMKNATRPDSMPKQGLKNGLKK